MTTKSALQPRLDELQALAIETFGSITKVDTWLHKEKLILGATPISMAESNTGLIEVKKVLSAISYGGVL